MGTAQYQRKANAPAIQLTADDQQILLDIYRHHILDSHTIRKVFPSRSPDWLGKRLRKLMDAGYLSKPVQQQKLHVIGGGSRPHAYTLGNAGARWLQQQKRLPVRIDRWTTTSSQLSASYLEHTLAVSRFMVSLRSAVEQTTNMAFEYPDQIYARIAPDILKRPRLPRALKTRVDWHGWREVEATIPDGFCALRYLDAPPEKSSRYLFVEIDRGTETIVPTGQNLYGRKFFRGSSILRKMVVYQNAYRTKAHTKIFGIPTFQAVFLALNRKHQQGIENALRVLFKDEIHQPNTPRFIFSSNSLSVPKCLIPEVEG